MKQGCCAQAAQGTSPDGLFNMPVGFTNRLKMTFFIMPPETHSSCSIAVEVLRPGSGWHSY